MQHRVTWSNCAVGAVASGAALYDLGCSNADLYAMPPERQRDAIRQTGQPVALRILGVWKWCRAGDAWKELGKPNSNTWRACQNVC